jgi:hypothetical protein
MAELFEGPRIPAAFTRRLHELHGKQFDAMASCIEVAARALELPRRDNLQRVVRSLVASMTNSMTAVGVLCRYGHGADAIRIARGMFEVLVTLRYLIARPAELRDYLEFDCVLRKERLQFYKRNHPALYDSFPVLKKAEVEQEYQRVKGRFLDSRNKVHRSWCKHTIAQVAEVGGLTDLYALFYFYASAVHHASPMGLGMLIDGESLEIEPAPQLAHVGIALRLAIHVLAEAIRSYCKLNGMDCESQLKAAENSANGESASLRLPQLLVCGSYCEHKPLRPSEANLSQADTPLARMKIRCMRIQL